MAAFCAGCGVKGPEFFTPQPTVTTTIIDTTPPVRTSQVPAPNFSGPLVATAVSATFDDPPGPEGPASGVNFSKASFVMNGQTLPVTIKGNEVDVSLAGQSDGQKSGTWNIEDNRGNGAKFPITIELKNSAPGVAFTQTPAATMQTNATSVTLTASGTVSGGSIVAATETILQPGSSGVCGGSDNTPVPANQVVGPSSVNLLPTVAANGSFSGAITLSNVVLPGGQPVTRTYCPTFVFEDGAMTATGQAAHHITTRSLAVQVTWSAASSATLSVNATYRHVGSGNEVCVNVLGTPGASYVGSISGPSFGATFAGAVGPSGLSISRVTVPQLGTYGGVVTSGSQTAGFSVDVTAAAGTCQ